MRRKPYHMCGECAYFDVDDHRTPSPLVGGFPLRLGTCRITKEIKDRCCIMRVCKDYYPKKKVYLPRVVPSDYNSVPVKCITDGVVFANLKDCATAYCIRCDYLRERLMKSSKKNGRIKWHNIEFEFVELEEEKNG